MNTDWLEEEGISSYGTLSPQNPEEKASSPKKIPELETFTIKSEPSKHKIWELAYYQPYFDVDTQTVFSRLKSTVNMISDGSFFENKQPDMYVPFWATTTLIFLFAAISANSVSDSAITQSTGAKLVSITTFMYSIAFLIPSIGYCYASHEGSTVSMIELVSLYGYSLIPFLFAGIICIFSHYIVRWCAMIFGCIWASYFFYKWIPIQNDAVLENKRYAICGLASLGHLLLVILANTYFF